MVKYQKYAEYQDSGVEWLGEIPNDWEMWKLSHAYTEIGSGTTPSTSNEENFEGNIPWVTTGELRENLILDTKKKVSQRTIEQFPTLKKYPIGSVAIAMYGATIGRLGIFGIEATTNQACCVMTTSKVLNNKYVFYWLQAFKNEIIQLSSGGGQPNINQEKVASLKISAPFFEDQINIANFLDYETAQIDTLISKQEKLIELLKEKRQAVISHAVTKGLNPDVVMKDSGVEWLGQVPEHWVVTRAKFVANVFIPQRNKPELNDSEGFAWVTMDDMKNKYIQNVNRYVTKNSAILAGSKVLEKGAVIASCVGNFGVTSINKIDVIINQQLQAFIPKNIKAEYLQNLVSISKNYFELIGTAATLVYVNQEGFQNLPVLLPPHDEQVAICLQTENYENKYDQLINLGLQQIKILQERRTALISSAVTGKINVSNWQHPNEAKTELSL